MFNCILCISCIIFFLPLTPLCKRDILLTERSKREKQNYTINTNYAIKDFTISPIKANAVTTWFTIHAFKHISI